MSNDPNDTPASHVSEDIAPYGAARKRIADVLKARPPLAPDGLPWPEGYFDRPPRVTLEEAIAESGVRPRRYLLGVPAYTQEDRDNPNYKDRFPPEPEWVAELEAEAERREKAGPQ